MRYCVESRFSDTPPQIVALSASIRLKKTGLRILGLSANVWWGVTMFAAFISRGTLRMPKSASASLLQPHLAPCHVFDLAGALSGTKGLGRRRVCEERQVEGLAALLGQVLNAQALHLPFYQSVDLSRTRGERHALLGPRPESQHVIPQRT